MKAMTRRWATRWAAAVCVMGAVAGVALADEGARVEGLLSGYELVPTAEDWAKAGDPVSVAARLMVLADDGARGVTQVRAMSSLAHFPTPEVEAFLGARATDVTRSPRIRGKAAIAWAAVAQERAAPAVVTLLAQADPRLREDATRALRLLAAPEVDALLDARVAEEPLPHLKDALRAAAVRVRANRAQLLADQRPVPSVALPTSLPPVPRRGPR